MIVKSMDCKRCMDFFIPSPNQTKGFKDCKGKGVDYYQSYWSFCQKYRKTYPGVVKSLESEMDDLLS